MDTDDLRILVAVAKNGSMNRAAGELHMVQSNVTARVRQLENELGVSLFVRHSRGVRLSEAGQRFLSYSTRIDALVHEAIAAARKGGEPTGDLRIGSLELTIALRFAPILARYTSRYPAVALTVAAGNSADLTQQVLDQALDGAFVLGPVSQSGLNVQPMFRDTLALVTGQSVRTIEELQQTSGTKALVLAQGCSFRERLIGILDSHSIQHQVLPVASFDAIRSMVEAGLGVTLLPKEFLRGPWKSAAITAHELQEASAQVETVFISRADCPTSSALEAFLLLSHSISDTRS